MKTCRRWTDERSGREGARFDIDSHGGEVAVVDRAVFQQPVTFGGRGPRRDDERRGRGERAAPNTACPTER